MEEVWVEDWEGVDGVRGVEDVEAVAGRLGGIVEVVNEGGGLWRGGGGRVVSEGNVAGLFESR